MALRTVSSRLAGAGFARRAVRIRSRASRRTGSPLPRNPSQAQGPPPGGAGRSLWLGCAAAGGGREEPLAGFAEAGGGEVEVGVGGEKVEIPHRLVGSRDELLEMIGLLIQEGAVAGEPHGQILRGFQEESQPPDGEKTPGDARREQGAEEAVGVREERPA